MFLYDLIVMRLLNVFRSFVPATPTGHCMGQLQGCDSEGISVQFSILPLAKKKCQRRACYRADTSFFVSCKKPLSFIYYKINRRKALKIKAIPN